MPSIELDHLTKSYGTAPPVLSDVTALLEGSGAVGYLGPNGAGKTTTLKLLVGLLTPTKGRALLNGLEAQTDRKRALWDVGALIETPEPYPSQSVYDALETIGQVRGLSTEGIDAEVDRLHEELELPPLERRCGALSKGQRQRVVLAAALLGDPTVLLLDEPTSGLDPAERVLVRGLLGRLKKDHLILMSSHQMVDVAEVCDRLIFIDRGTILLQETVAKVSERFRPRQLDVEFLAAVEPAQLSGFSADVVGIDRVAERRYRLTFDGSDAARLRILESCQKVGPVGQFSNAALLLEEAYLEVVAAAPGH
jgi:ABC-2 type transport system ATP-binding protein